MRAHQAEFRIATMARVLGVSPSGYYAWRKRKRSAREHSDEALSARVREIHRRSRGTYGAPRIHAELAAEGTQVSRKRVARVMREAGLCGVSRRKGPRTTRRDPQARPAPDLVERRFDADGPDRLWVADITYVATAAGFVWTVDDPGRPYRFTDAEILIDDFFAEVERTLREHGVGTTVIAVEENDS